MTKHDLPLLSTEKEKFADDYKLDPYIFA